MVFSLQYPEFPFCSPRTEGSSYQLTAKDSNVRSGPAENTTSSVFSNDIYSRREAWFLVLESIHDNRNMETGI